jgi:hypothetical protein
VITCSSEWCVQVCQEIQYEIRALCIVTYINLDHIILFKVVSFLRVVWLQNFVYICQLLQRPTLALLSSWIGSLK